MMDVSRCRGVFPADARYTKLVKSKLSLALQDILYFESLADLPSSHSFRHHQCEGCAANTDR